MAQENARHGLVRLVLAGLALSIAGCTASRPLTQAGDAAIDVPADTDGDTSREVRVDATVDAGSLGRAPRDETVPLDAAAKSERTTYFPNRRFIVPAPIELCPGTFEGPSVDSWTMVRDGAWKVVLPAAEVAVTPFVQPPEQDSFSSFRAPFGLLVRTASAEVPLETELISHVWWGVGWWDQPIADDREVGAFRIPLDASSPLLGDGQQFLQIGMEVGQGEDFVFSRVASVYVQVNRSAFEGWRSHMADCADPGPRGEVQVTVPDGVVTMERMWPASFLATRLMRAYGHVGTHEFDVSDDSRLLSIRAINLINPDSIAHAVLFADEGDVCGFTFQRQYDDQPHRATLLDCNLDVMEELPVLDVKLL